MIITTRLTMDLQQPGYPPIVNAVQSDQYSRAVCLALYSGGTAWSVPAGATVAVRYTTPAGTRGYYDTMPDGSKAWAVAGNEITVYIAPQMLTAPGLVPAQVEIISGSSVLGTFPFHLRVSADLAEQIKTEEDYVNWLAWMQSQLEQALVDAKESGAFTGPPPTLVSKSVTYQAGSSGTTPPTGSWSSSVPTVAQGQYLWTRTVLTFDTGSVTTYQVGYMGVDATVKSQAVTYQAGDSGTTAPTGTWSSAIPTVAQGKYLWTRTVTQFNSGSAATSYSVARQGIDGTGSVSSVAGISPDAAGNVALTAADVGAVPDIVPTPTEEQDAANKTYVDGLVQAAAPWSKLDNGDFTDPVNQRGFSSGGNGQYTIDRWMAGSTSTFSLTSAGIVVPGTASAAVYIRQRFPTLADGTYTAAVYDDSGGVWVWRVVRISGSTVTSVSSGGTGGNVTVNRQSGYDEVLITVNASTAKTLTAAALYAGQYTVIPAYRPKGYATELAACKRYYYRIPALQRWREVGLASGTIDFWIPIPDMRAVPAVDFTSLAVRTMAGAAQDGFEMSILASANTCGLVIRAEKSAHGLTAAQLLASTAVALTADL